MDWCALEPGIRRRKSWSLVIHITELDVLRSIEVELEQLCADFDLLTSNAGYLNPLPCASAVVELYRWIVISSRGLMSKGQD